MHFTWYNYFLVNIILCNTHAECRANQLQNCAFFFIMPEPRLGIIYSRISIKVIE